MQVPIRRLDNLIVFVDHNHLQSSGTCEEILPMGCLADKWKAFGWNVLEMNGHDMMEIVSKINVAINFRGMPTVIIAHTIKGKGISFMENTNKWHAAFLPKDKYEIAMKELEGGNKMDVVFDKISNRDAFWQCTGRNGRER